MNIIFESNAAINFISILTGLREPRVYYYLVLFSVCLLILHQGLATDEKRTVRPSSVPNFDDGEF